MQTLAANLGPHASVGSDGLGMAPARPRLKFCLPQHWQRLRYKPNHLALVGKGGGNGALDGGFAPPLWGGWGENLALGDRQVHCGRTLGERQGTAAFADGALGGLRQEGRVAGQWGPIAPGRAPPPELQAEGVIHELSL